MDQMVATIPKNRTERVQVSLRTFEGHDLIDIRVFWTPDGGKSWNPSKKGVSLNVQKLPVLLGCLHKAALLVGEDDHEIAEEELLTPAERAILAKEYDVSPDEVEELAAAL